MLPRTTPLGGVATLGLQNDTAGDTENLARRLLVRALVRADLQPRNPPSPWKLLQLEAAAKLADLQNQLIGVGCYFAPVAGCISP